MFSPLHPLDKLRRDSGRMVDVRPTKHEALWKRIGELLLSLLFHYRVLLLVLWVVAIIVWLFSEILLVEPGPLESDKE